jgi:hypothetical protein
VWALRDQVRTSTLLFDQAAIISLLGWYLESKEIATAVARDMQAASALTLGTASSHAEPQRHYWLSTVDSRGCQRWLRTTCLHLSRSKAREYCPIRQQ